MQNNKIGMRIKEGERKMQLCHLGGEGLTEKVTFEEKAGGGSEPSRYLRKGHSGRGTSKCKGPVVGQCLGELREQQGDWN